MVSNNISSFHCHMAIPNTKEEKKNIYEQIIKVLNQEKKDCLYQLSKDKEILNAYHRAIERKDSFEFWSLGMEKVSLLSVAFFRELDFSFSQLNSLHLVITAYNKLLLHSNYHAHLLKMTKITTPVSFFRKDFKNHFNDDREESFEVINHYPFFSFTKEEWKNFCFLMLQEHVLEQMGYIFSISHYSFLILYQKMFFEGSKSFFSSRKQNSRQGSTEFNSDQVFIPSFSMLKNALRVKVESREQSPISLIPILGSITNQDQLNSSRVLPFQLHFPIQSVSKQVKMIQPIQTTTKKNSSVILEYSDFIENLKTIDDSPVFFSEEYDEIKENIVIDEINYDSEIKKIKFLNCKIKVLKCFSAFIEGSEIEQIIASGELYIQNSRITSISSMGNIFIRKCQTLNLGKMISIKSESNIVFEINSVPGKKEAKKIYAVSSKENEENKENRKIDKKALGYHIEGQIKCETFIPSINTSTIYYNSNLKAEKIEFIQSSPLNEVIEEPSYYFHGKIEKGQLVRKKII